MSLVSLLADIVDRFEEDGFQGGMIDAPGAPSAAALPEKKPALGSLPTPQQQAVEEHALRKLLVALREVESVGRLGVGQQGWWETAKWYDANRQKVRQFDAETLLQGVTATLEHGASLQEHLQTEAEKLKSIIKRLDPPMRHLKVRLRRYIELRNPKCDELAQVQRAESLVGRWEHESSEIQRCIEWLEELDLLVADKTFLATIDKLEVPDKEEM